MNHTPDVGILLERLTDGETKSPKGDVIRDIRSADGTEA